LADESQKRSDLQIGHLVAHFQLTLIHDFADFAHKPSSGMANENVIGREAGAEREFPEM
jgi:hypothetical protein